VYANEPLFEVLEVITLCNAPPFSNSIFTVPIVPVLLHTMLYWEPVVQDVVPPGDVMEREGAASMVKEPLVALRIGAAVVATVMVLPVPT
jgi:hypothetical protein